MWVCLTHHLTDRGGGGGGVSAKYVLDSTYSLYGWEGLWHIGESGKSILYTTLHPSSAPPESNVSATCAAGWSTKSGAAPCPAVERSGLGPAPPSPPPAPPAAGAGTKLKMELCSATAAAQKFATTPDHDTDRCKLMLAGQQQDEVAAAAGCVTIRPKAAADGPVLCATVLAERWPWWVSLLPCDETDPRQVWLSRSSSNSAGSRQLVASNAAVHQPWPSGKTGKCVNGTCALEGCLEVEGANPEVDQCDWSTTSSQFLWENTAYEENAQLKNAMSGECLSIAGECL